VAVVIDWLKPRVILGLARRRVLAGRDAVEGLVSLVLFRQMEADDLIETMGFAEADHTRILQQRLDEETRRFQTLELAHHGAVAELKRRLEVETKRYEALEGAKLADEKALLAAQLANAKLRGPILAAMGPDPNKPGPSRPGADKGRIAIVTPDIVGPVKNGGIGTACFHYARTRRTRTWNVCLQHHASRLIAALDGDAFHREWAKVRHFKAELSEVSRAADSGFHWDNNFFPNLDGTVLLPSQTVSAGTRVRDWLRILDAHCRVRAPRERLGPPRRGGATPHAEAR
jgi:hypothetical protein